MTRVCTLLLLTALLFFSCSKQKGMSSNPVYNKILGNNDCRCKPYIQQYEWRSKTVYVLAFLGTCDWKLTYYNGYGDQFTMDNATWQAFAMESKFIGTAWSCEQ